MATYTVAAGDFAVHAKTLTADTEDIVDFPADLENVEVLVHSGDAPVYFTVNRAAATVAGGNTDVVTAGSAVQVPVGTSGNTQVRLISAAACVYSVTKT